MLNIFEYIINGHVHKWNIIEVVPYKYTDGITSVSCSKYILQCEHCGNIKTKVAK